MVEIILLDVLIVLTQALLVLLPAYILWLIFEENDKKIKD